MKKKKSRAVRRKRAKHPSGVNISAQAKQSPLTPPSSKGDQIENASINLGEFVAYDENLLERSRTQWQFGDWESLAKLERNTLQHHPDRAKLALLAAAGHIQLGDSNAARQFTRLAQDWGCSKKLISQLLISGLHNSLGRAAAISNQEQRAIKHFECSVAVVMPQADIRLLGQNRIIRETAKLGLLPQAARLMAEELSAMKREANLDSSRLSIFQTELELLHHELSLAQQRQQLYGTTNKEALPGVTINQDNPLWLEALKKRSVSQLGQDIWVLQKTGFKNNGYFVEFGATDGVLLSNSWLLEKEFGWQGICAEPNPKFFEQLKINRNCHVSPACITGQSGKKIEFILADAYGGSQEYADDDQHSDKRSAYRAAGHVVSLTGISLNDFLEHHKAPREIDYLSIDTEGSEFEILENFPFDQWNIRLLTIEHNFTERRADIRILMERHNYRCTEQQWDDWYELEMQK
ncbi:MAG: FkbM family methyltransferase [Methylococcaceae bacterium]